MSPRIDITDLKVLNRELRALEGDAFKRGLQPVLKSFATGVAGQVRAQYTRRYPSVSGHGAASIRGVASGSSAAVVIGGSRAPYLLGQEFGSDRYPQFRPWTGKGPGGAGSRGRFLYPTIRREIPELHEEVMDAVMGVAGRVFNEQGVLTRAARFPRAQ